MQSINIGFNLYLLRVFSRIAIIPFNPISKVQTLESCLDLKAKLHPLLEKAVLSIGTMVELRSAFEGMREDDIFKDICSLMNNTQLDMRSQLNYELILFATRKVLLSKYWVKGKWILVNIYQLR